MILIPESERRSAWEWLAREAIAGNTHATVALVEWSKRSIEHERPKPHPFPTTSATGPLNEPAVTDTPPLGQLALTFQWWLDHDDRRTTPTPGMFVIPPRVPSVRKATEWISAITDTAAKYHGSKYAEDLIQIARCLSLLTGHPDVVEQDAPMNPPAWPTRPVLESWIMTLTAAPPRKGTK